MKSNADWLTTNRAAPGRQGGGVWTSLLVSTLGMAVVMPGLMLQGVATRTRSGDVDLDEPASAPLAPNSDEAAQASDSGIATRSDAAAVSATGAASDGTVPRADIADQSDGTDNRPGQSNGRPGARINRNGKPRPERPELTQAERIARRRERQERKAAVGDLRPERPKSAATSAAGTVDAVTEPETRSSSTALAPVGSATVAPVAAAPGANENQEGETAIAEAVPPGPVTFEEVQAAHQAAAVAFRDVRKSLNAAYMLIGRLNVERYQAQYELAELKGLPLPERPPERSWRSAAKPVAPREAKRVKKNRPEDDEELVADEEVKRIARRRQLMVLIGVAALGVFILAYRMIGWNWFPDITDRQAMTQIAGLGVIMQVFFLVFFLFRLGMITGRGKSWLFPTPEQEAFKRRRKRMRGH